MKPSLPLSPTRFTAEARVAVNDNVRRLIGEGALDVAAGRVVGDYEFDRSDELPGLLFKAVMVTGYPSVCHSSDSDPNPFQHGAYSYQRRVDLGEWGALEYKADCRQDGDLLVSRFDVSGDYTGPRLAPAERIIETWIPDDDGILGSFAIAWPRADGGGYVVGQARTLYKPHPRAPALGRIRHRSIRFPASAADGIHLHITQQSELL